MTAYTIVGTRRIAPDLVTVQFVTDALRYMHVTVPYARSSSTDLDTVIAAAIAGLHRPTKPLSPYLKAG